VISSPDFRLICELRSVPDRHDPDGLTLGPIEEAVRGNDDFAIRQLGEFRDQSTRLREPGKTSKHLFSPPAELPRRVRVVPMNIGRKRQELKAA